MPRKPVNNTKRNTNTKELPVIDKKIYLALPYTHPDPKVRESRFNIANGVAGRIMKQGYLVFSPISHTHPIAEKVRLPKEWDFWKRQDETFLHWCDEFWVLMMSGWKESKGVQAEIEIAKELGKPIKYIKGLKISYSIDEEAIFIFDTDEDYENNFS